MVEQPILVKIAAWFATLLPAIVGSAISLRMAAENSTFLGRMFSFTVGVALAHYVGGAIVDTFTIDRLSMVDEAIVLASGIFGMSTASEITKQLPEIIKGFSERLANFLKK